ncbi:M48 family metalloprotease [Porticoccus sp. W117]|uniref:M48 family metalloprotease n=1 Tax=Porticoccus sp. W117 TaxID=3054777 RepID=UPI002592BD33|nr:M48 family metalloprotease [Porticoccus sp. W117]MDM3871431.1 M48 family metalloprotease [Porticoccus sp. W117]
MLATLLVSAAQAQDANLPELSDASSAGATLEKEHELGRLWLKAFRSRTQEYPDPETQQYVEQLIYRLLVHSELKDRRLEIAVVDNPTMNAFAVPGGVVGVHNGLFNFAESEHQLASVLAHELAHLSQRHFARGLQERKKNSVTAMAGLLAGLVLAATSKGDAGIAALTASQALSQDQQLRYSRQNEQEADRIGIETLHKAGLDPNGAPRMFERMQHASRFSGQRVPEFLRTHPLTEKRISDTQLRANDYDPKEYEDNLDYHLIRARILLHFEGNASRAAKRFRSQLKGTDGTPPQAAQYGLVLALIAGEKLTEARQELNKLQKQGSNQLYKLAELDLLLAQGNNEEVIRLARKQLLLYPNNHALKIKLATAYTKAKKFQLANQQLTQLSRQRPTDPQVWYQLAEVRGLAGDIVGLHRARAEYFILVGAFNMARDQLNHAAKLSRHDFQQSAIINEKLIQLAALEKQIEKL